GTEDAASTWRRLEVPLQVPDRSPFHSFPISGQAAAINQVTQLLLGFMRQAQSVSRVAILFTIQCTNVAVITLFELGDLFRRLCEELGIELLDLAPLKEG